MSLDHLPEPHSYTWVSKRPRWYVVDERSGKNLGPANSYSSKEAAEGDIAGFWATNQHARVSRV